MVSGRPSLVQAAQPVHRRRLGWSASPFAFLAFTFIVAGTFACQPIPRQMGSSDAAARVDAPAEVQPSTDGADASADVNDALDQVDLGHRSPEEYWLDKVGTGPVQTARVCQRGSGDPVAKALCAPAVRLGGLADLYRALDFPADPGVDQVALASASSGLSFRVVSALNPRVFVMTPTLTISEKVRTTGLAVAAFARGEQLVELSGSDPRTGSLKFYLLSFKQDCSDRGCRPDELLGPVVESDWRSWTLYEADDLVDTPLDCLACHQPNGHGTERSLLMRDIPSPWFHWFPGDGERRPCLDPATEDRMLVDLRSTFEGANPRGYGALAPEGLTSANGHNLHSFIFLFAEEMGIPATDAFTLPSQVVVRESLCAGVTDSWRDYRRSTLLEHGFPIPSYEVENLDPLRAAPARLNYATFLKDRSGTDSFELMAGLLSDQHLRNVGGLPDANLDAPGILREMCIRCHDGRAPRTFVRGRFDARAVTAMSAARALERLDLPPRSPYLMPPRSAGTLPDAERARVRMLLQGIVAAGN